jgi:hypothetical protein
MAALGTLSVGSKVKLNISGSAKNFIVVHQGLPSSVYDSSCDGTWLLMEDLYTASKFGSNNKYADSDIHSYLNNTFINLLDNGIKEKVKQIKIPNALGLTSNLVSNGSSGLSTKIFLLSATELYWYASDNYVPVVGACLSYFNGALSSKRKANLNGTATSWWSRTPYTSMGYDLWSVTANGGFTNLYCTTKTYGVRPALVLPPELLVDDSGFVITAEPFAPNLRMNVGGTAKGVVGMYMNKDGTIKKALRTYQNINGVVVES